VGKDTTLFSGYNQVNLLKMKPAVTQEKENLRSTVAAITRDNLGKGYPVKTMHDAN
jgi:hypothetical protein